MDTLYVNALGGLESKANISALGYSCGYNSKAVNPRFHLKTTSNAPDREWPIITTPEDTLQVVIADMERDGWDCTVRLNGYNRHVIDCTHRATQEAINAYLAARDAKFAGAVHGYIRFGKMPKDGRSWNHRDNCPEQGVSVFEAEFAPDGSFRLINLTHVLQLSHLTVMDRQAYRVYGDVIGTGADGEPVLKVRKAVRI